MSSELTTESTRRRLTERQADTVRRLTDAAVVEVREAGYEGLTVRNVARRAGVAPATAYTYFASKNHLITEVFWRRLHALPPVAETVAAPGTGGVVTVLREIALLVSDEPELAAACTTAMLGTDPDVRELRIRIGVAIRDRLRAALGRDDPKILGALELAYAGALVHAGMGYTSYARMADRLAEMAELILPDPE
ncbi:TetR/AcrR family transcriptional regulator [Actinomadura parmotrematis]|uniref:TetR/AcrR family transcriptional regulator n=1 Tax=Actinomadura parmotrematis TaxID=2864039 RepID=UPI0027E27AAD|nr:helix-turn-helix domain-containing protein [Actinomadura parmotrematis]